MSRRVGSVVPFNLSLLATSFIESKAIELPLIEELVVIQNYKRGRNVANW